MKKHGDDTADFLSTAEAAALTSFSREYVTRLAREGRIMAQRSGRAWRIDAASLLAFHGAQKHAMPAGAGAPHRESAASQEEEPSVPQSEVVASMHSAVRKLAEKKGVTRQIQTAPLYAIHPTLDLLHRATALVGALAFAIGLSAFLYPPSFYLASGVAHSMAASVSAAVGFGPGF